MQELIKVKCPICGHEQNIFYDKKDASCKGVFLRCKARHCKEVFELKINQDK